MAEAYYVRCAVHPEIPLANETVRSGTYSMVTASTILKKKKKRKKRNRKEDSNWVCGIIVDSTE
jgi:hypothetical protein